MDKIDESFNKIEDFFMGYFRPVKELIDLQKSLDVEKDGELYDRIDWLLHYLDKIYLTDYAYELED